MRTARAVAQGSGPPHRPVRCLLVDDADPQAAAERLAGARASGLVPVVVGPGWPAAVTAPVLAAAEERLPPDEDLLVVLTSGSTSAPRAVVRSWASWQSSFAPLDLLTGLGSDDVLWVPGTPASTLTLFAVLHGLESGAEVATTGPWRGLGSSAPAVHEAARTATAVHAVPQVAAEILAAAASGELPRLALVVTAGARVPVSLRAAAARAGVRLVEYYGAAELSFVAVDPDGTGLRPFPGVQVEVRDGTVWARSPYLARGYLIEDGSGPLRRDGDGWAGVGDRARRGAGGRLLVDGRPAGAAACVGATTVLLEDVEAVLREVAGVADVVCVAEPSTRLGERIVAVVQPLPGADPIPALRTAARTGLPAAARPVRWLLDPRLPTTAAGKVDRRAVRELARLRGAAGPG